MSHLCIDLFHSKQIQIITITHPRDGTTGRDGGCRGTDNNKIVVNEDGDCRIRGNLLKQVIIYCLPRIVHVLF